MRHILSPRSRDILRQFVAPRVLFVFDFDGTLAPIVDSPERARMRPATRTILRHLTGLRTCLVLSGRSCADLRRKLVGSGIRHLIGNHGAELSENAQRIRREVRLWARVLARELPDIAGLWVEDKTLSLTVHYRQCRRRAAARSAIANAARSLTGARLIEGKEAVSIVSADAPDKGTALRAEMSRLESDRALYVGDDDTDEDVFALREDGFHLLKIRIGWKKQSKADYFLRDQEEIDELLHHLLVMSTDR